MATEDPLKPDGLLTLAKAPAGAAAAPSPATAPAAAPAPDLKPMTVTPGAAPAGMKLEQGSTVNTSGQSYTPTAYTQAVDPTKTVQGLLTQAMDKNGELMRIAEHRGYNQANRRGLGNSSVAAQASMGAMIDAAIPIAQADAGLHQQQALTNQQAMNTAAGASNEFQSADMKMRQEVELKRITDTLTSGTLNEEYRNRFIQQYMEGVNNVLNNKDLSPEQKQASINKMYENLNGSVALQSSSTGIDFSKYKPGGSSPQAGGSPDQQEQFLATNGIYPSVILDAKARKIPLVQPDGSFLVISPGFGGRAVYYNPARSTYSDAAGAAVPQSLVDSVYVTKERPWTGVG